ncbi:hypothetical protein OROHE_000090 [Orobanche hederae]
MLPESSGSQNPVGILYFSGTDFAGAPDLSRAPDFAGAPNLAGTLSISGVGIRGARDNKRRWILELQTIDLFDFVL